MTEFVVVYEKEFAPQRDVNIIEAESADEAAAQLVDSVPPGIGITVRVLNVVPVDAPIVTDAPALALVE